MSHLTGEASFAPEIEARAYFNHAAITPPSPPVMGAMSRAMGAFAKAGSNAFLGALEERATLKRNLAQLLCGDPSLEGAFAFMPNTTSALQAIAHAISWREGDTILLFEGEFPTNIIPWRQASARHNLTLEWASLEPLARLEGPDWSEVEAALKRGVRLVCVSAVQFQTGLRVPLEDLADLCERWGAELCVDGIQACGVAPLPMSRIDYLASGGHKWMMAVEGAGFLYVNPKRLSALTPQGAGWLSLEDPISFLFEPSADLGHHKPLRAETSAFEGGAQATLCYAALAGATELLLSVRDQEGRKGIDAIYNHINALNDQLEEGLNALGFESARSPDLARRSGILSVRPSPEMGGVSAIPTIANAWAERGLVCATPNGYLRLSPHWYNSAEQVSFALEVAQAAL